MIIIFYLSLLSVFCHLIDITTSLIHSSLGHIVPILIYGWPHSGTTIRNKIILSYDNVCGNLRSEMKSATSKQFRKAERKGCTHVVVKWPWDMTSEITSSKIYKDYLKIVLVRNPYWIFSSINRRMLLSPKQKSNYTFAIWERSALNFKERTAAKQTNSPETFIYLQYEHMFTRIDESLQHVADKFGLHVKRQNEKAKGWQCC